MIQYSRAIILACTLGAGKRTLLAWEAQILHKYTRTEYLFDVVPPDEGSQDVREQVRRFVVVLAHYVAMGNASHQ